MNRPPIADHNPTPGSPTHSLIYMSRRSLETRQGTPSRGVSALLQTRRKTRSPSVKSRRDLPASAALDKNGATTRD